MPTPPDLILKLRFDEQGFPVIIGRKNHLNLIHNQEIKVELHVEKFDDSFLPPGFKAFDITGWVGQWIGKADINDLDVDKKWDVAGVIIDAAGGKITFTVLIASVNFEVKYGYSEFVFNTGGSSNIRVPLTFTLSKPVLAT